MSAANAWKGLLGRTARPRPEQPRAGIMPKPAALSRPALFQNWPRRAARRKMQAVAKFPSKQLGDLIVDDEASFSHVALYEDLHRIVARSDHRFLVLHGNVRRATWDRALFLNLTFWHAAEAREVLADEHIAADVV